MRHRDGPIDRLLKTIDPTDIATDPDEPDRRWPKRTGACARCGLIVGAAACPYCLAELGGVRLHRSIHELRRIIGIAA